MSHVQQRHVLFPLAVMGFYARQPPTAVFQDVWEAHDAVPPHVLVLHPEMTPAQYSPLRADERWLAAAVCLCEQCTAGIASVMENIHVAADGTIREPFGKRERAPRHSAGGNDSVASTPGRRQQSTSLPPLSPTPTKNM
jgi:hypothetical protein